MTTNRPLRVFLCHSSADKPAVRELYQKLRAEPWIQPWLDEEELYPGQDWETEIEKAVELSDVVLVCLSNGSINKRGFVQKELRFALDVALEMPEDAIFIIPLRLEECTPPRSLRDWQYADYFEDRRDRAFQRLLVSLRRRAAASNVDIELLVSGTKNEDVEQSSTIVEKHIEKSKSNELIMARQEILVCLSKRVNQYKSRLKNAITLADNFELMHVPVSNFLMGSIGGIPDVAPQRIVEINYDFWMARYPITNEQYSQYVKSSNLIHPVRNWENKKNHPVTNVTWASATLYCLWLNDLLKSIIPSGLVLRLPVETEWEKAARGIDGRRYPWGNEYEKDRCNSSDEGNRGTTPVGLYSPKGDSPYGCADMSGNVWEWTSSLFEPFPKVNDFGGELVKSGGRALRGGSYNEFGKWLHCMINRKGNTHKEESSQGFRVCLAPPLSK